MADKESSVLFSLQELMNLEKSRVLEEQQDEKARREAEARARAESEARARQLEEERVRAEDERRRAAELRRRLEEAQIEAAKEAEIERARLAQQHILEMDALARKRQHEKELETIAAARPKGLPRAALFGVLAAMVAALGVIAFLVFLQPVSAAREAVHRAEIAAASDDPEQWLVADRQLAIARDKDPKNPGIAAVESTLKGKRDALAAKMAKDRADADAKLKALQGELDAKKKLLDAAKTEAEKKALQSEVKGLETKIGVATPPPPTSKNCKEVPGCPLCPKVCN